MYKFAMQLFTLRHATKVTKNILFKKLWYVLEYLEFLDSSNWKYLAYQVLLYDQTPKEPLFNRGFSSLFISETTLSSHS